MVAFPLLIIASTLGYSMVDPEGNSIIPTSWMGSISSLSTSSKKSHQTHDRWIFAYGVVLGMGLSTALSYEIRRRRWFERARLTIFSWMGNSTESLLGKYRRPTPISDVDKKPLIVKGEDREIECGITQEIISSHWCLTSTMSAARLSLSPGAELMAQESVGVEFYYVMKGDGTFRKETDGGNGVEEMRVVTGDCFVVDPFRRRGFVASGRSELILLRVVDDASIEGNDAVRWEENGLASPTAIVRTGLRKVEAMVAKYNEGQSHSNANNDIY